MMEKRSLYSEAAISYSDRSAGKRRNKAEKGGKRRRNTYSAKYMQDGSYRRRKWIMTNGLVWAILGLGIGFLVTKAIENKYTFKMYLYIILIACLAALIIWLKVNHIL